MQVRSGLQSLVGDPELVDVHWRRRRAEGFCGFPPHLRGARLDRMKVFTRLPQGDGHELAGGTVGQDIEALVPLWLATWSASMVAGAAPEQVILNREPGRRAAAINK
jgi:hypothetical protein